jgi:hypothetical protein
MKAEPESSAFVFALRSFSDWSDCPPAADEVHDDRDHGEEEQQVNEEAAHMQDQEAAKPEQDQHNSQNKKHGMTFFLGTVCRAGREWYRS